METKILISGFGGQGLMSLGRILAKAAVYEGKHSIFFPSYGAEMRGGTAHCFVKISPTPIASPFIASPDVAIIFNQPSLDKFKLSFRKNSLVILNADLVVKGNLSTAQEIFSLPLNKMALECGDLKMANMVALGVLNVLKPELLRRKTILAVLKESFKGKSSLAANLRAFQLGEGFSNYL